MADLKQIQFKRSKTAGAKPTISQIAEGELAINLTDRTLFTNDGTQIVDLGFAKGGTINGNVVQTGSYTQTGDYTTSGDINAKTITLSAGVVSNGDISSRNGVLRTRANSASNAHLWFEGVEMGEANTFERGVLYARPNTETNGTISFRVKNGFNNNGAQALFNFHGSGDFDAPRDLVATRDLLAQRSRLSIESVAPTMNASRLYTRGRKYAEFGGGENGYGWNDLVNYNVGENGALALNYVYTGRAMNSGTIWHQLLDERSGAEWALYTGTGPTNKVFSVFSQSGLGQGKFTGSLMVGGDASDISSLGTNSITIGENNTGIRRTSTGNLDFISSGGMNFRFSAPEGANRSYKRLYVQHSDANGSAITPPTNSAQLQIDTSGDNNNTSGNGLTLIGYYTTGGEYNHYFRGKGEAVFNMGRGVNISNSLTVGGSVNPGNYSNFDSRYQNLFNLGANVNLDNLLSDSQLGEYSQNANANTSLALNYPEAQAGHLTVTAGAGVQQRYHVYNSTRVYLRAKYSTDAWKPWDRVVTDDYLGSGINGSIVSKVADGFRIAYNNYGFFIRNDGANTYFMLTNAGDNMGTWNGLRPITISNSTGTVSIGTPLIVTHASGLTVNSTAGDAISWGNAGACVANDGNLRGTFWKAFGGNDWAGGALTWVNAQNVAKSGDTMTGALTLANGQITLGGGSGSVNFSKAGANPRNMRIYIGGDASRGNRLEIADDTSYLAYFERHPSSGIQLMMNGNGNFANVYIRSDVRLKRNFKKIENAVDKVDKLNGYIYEKTDKIGGTEFKVEAGIIAQELKEVLPEAVESVSMDNGEETLTVSSAATIALLVNAIKELNARIEYLESK